MAFQRPVASVEMGRAKCISPACGGDVKMPEEGAGDRGHQRVMMKTSLGTTFEAVEAELFLSCLQRLCFDLKCADRCCAETPCCVQNEHYAAVAAMLDGAPSPSLVTSARLRPPPLAR
jgi:hypothetical protein